MKNYRLPAAIAIGLAISSSSFAKTGIDEKFQIAPGIYD